MPGGACDRKCGLSETYQAADGFHRLEWTALAHSALCRAIQGRAGEATELLTRLARSWRTLRPIASGDWLPSPRTPPPWPGRPRPRSSIRCSPRFRAEPVGTGRREHYRRRGSCRPRHPTGHATTPGRSRHLRRHPGRHRPNSGARRRPTRTGPRPRGRGGGPPPDTGVRHHGQGAAAAPVAHLEPAS